MFLLSCSRSTASSIRVIFSHILVSLTGKALSNIECLLSKPFQVATHKDVGELHSDITHILGRQGQALHGKYKSGEGREELDSNFIQFPC